MGSRNTMPDSCQCARDKKTAPTSTTSSSQDPSSTDNYEDWTKERPYFLCIISGQRIYIRCNACLTRDELIRKKMPLPESEEQANRDLIDSPIWSCSLILDWYLKFRKNKEYRQACTHVVYSALEQFSRGCKAQKSPPCLPSPRTSFDTDLIAQFLEEDILMENVYVVVQ